MSGPTPTAGPAAVVYPPDGTVSPFTVINLGAGAVQMGDCIHDHRLPALWFGKNGQGMGHEEVMNREAREGETLAVITFANVEGLDVLASVIQRIRRVSFPNAGAATAQAGAEPVATLHADGYWTHKPGRDPLDRFSGKARLDVYAAPAPQPAPAERQPLSIARLTDWLAPRFRAAGGKAGITDVSAWAEEVMRWTEAQHSITTKEQL